MSAPPVDAIVIDSLPGETRVAQLAGGRLAAIEVQRAQGGSRVGDIYLGRVRGLARGLQAAFVDIGIGPEGFLPLSEAAGAAEGVHEGLAVVVQVTRDAAGGKGVKLTARPSLAGHALVLTPTEAGASVSRRLPADERRRLQQVAERLAADGCGVIVRTEAAGTTDAALADEAARLKAAWAEIEAAAGRATPPTRLSSAPGAVERALRDAPGGVGRIVVEGPAHAEVEAAARRLRPDLAARVERHAGRRPLFAELEIDALIEAALVPEVPLPSGGSLVIETVAALTAIDVNAAGRAEGGAERTALAVNLDAVAEAAWQLRLRGIGGQVVIDPVSMKRADNRRRVEAALRAATAADPDVQVVGTSRLGLIELTRRRRRPPLAEVLTAPCPACGDGRLAAPETVGFEILRRLAAEARATPGGVWTAACAATVADALNGPLRGAVAETTSRLGTRLRVQAVPALDAAPHRFDLAPGRADTSRQETST